MCGVCVEREKLYIVEPYGSLSHLPSILSIPRSSIQNPVSILSKSLNTRLIHQAIYIKQDSTTHLHITSQNRE